jgi:hypothetical protein
MAQDLPGSAIGMTAVAKSGFSLRRRLRYRGGETRLRAPVIWWRHRMRKTALAIPTAEREATKEKLRAELMREELAPLRAQAQALHEAVLGNVA